MQLYSEFLEEFLFLIMTWGLVFSNIFFNFHPENWFQMSNLTCAYFSDGWEKNTNQLVLLTQNMVFICHDFRFTL